jgi:hypothetical protein
LGEHQRSQLAVEDSPTSVLESATQEEDITTPVEAAAQAYLADRKINGAAPKTLANFRPILALYANWAGDRAPE